MARRTRRPLAPATAFWDASALVPLGVSQSNAAHAIVLYKRYQAVVWWVTPIEMPSAPARLVRIRQLGAADWTKARHLASRLADGMVSDSAYGCRANQGNANHQALRPSRSRGTAIGCRVRVVSGLLRGACC